MTPYREHTRNVENLFKILKLINSLQINIYILSEIVPSSMNETMKMSAPIGTFERSSNGMSETL